MNNMSSIFSFITIHKIKKINHSLYIEEISYKVKNKLNHESRLFRRITNVFPDFNIISKVIK